MFRRSGGDLLRHALRRSVRASRPAEGGTDRRPSGPRHLPGGQRTHLFLRPLSRTVEWRGRELNDAQTHAEMTRHPTAELSTKNRHPRASRPSINPLNHPASRCTYTEQANEACEVVRRRGSQMF